MTADAMTAAAMTADAMTAAGPVSQARIWARSCRPESALGTLEAHFDLTPWEAL